MKKLLATIIAAGAIAATVLGASASENVVYEETFNNETTTLWGWSTENNSVKKYTGYAEFNTSGLGSEAALSKANGVSNAHILSNTIADHYRTNTSINMRKAVEKNMADNVWVYKQETYNTKYNMSYAVCYDSIWVYDSNKNWVKGIDITNSSDVLSDFTDNFIAQASIPYEISVEVEGASAKITVEHSGKSYIYSWIMPGTSSSGPDKMNNIRMSSNSKGFGGYNMVRIDNVKITNIFDNEVIFDDVTAADFSGRTYGSNVQAEDFTNYIWADKQLNLSLKDRSVSTEGTEANTIYYTIPEGAIVDNFYAFTITPRGVQEVVFYGVKNGNKTKLTTSSNVVYVTQWGRHYYMPSDISANEYDGIAVELGGAGGTAGSTLVSMQIEYEIPPEFYPLNASKEEVIIDDDFKVQRWHHEAANLVEFPGWCASFNSKNASDATMKISKMWTDPIYSATQMLMGVIGDNYRDYTEYNIQKLIKENDVANGGFGLKKTIVNGKYEMAYAVCYDGIYVKDSTGWKKVKDIVNPANLYEDINDFSASVDYFMTVEVKGKEATLAAKYQDEKSGALKTFNYTWEMPATASFNDVRIESYVKDGATHKAFIWQTDSTGNTTMVPIFPTVTDGE